MFCTYFIVGVSEIEFTKNIKQRICISIKLSGHFYSVFMSNLRHQYMSSSIINLFI